MFQERVNVSTSNSDGSSSSRTEIHTHYGSKSFFRLKIPVYNFSAGQIPPGQYTFPF